jgi:hypothetical protein
MPSNSRDDVYDATGRRTRLAGGPSTQTPWAAMRGWPMNTADYTGNGIPTNGIGGFQKGATWQNFKSTVTGTVFYINIGTSDSATWLNIDGATGGTFAGNVTIGGTLGVTGAITGSGGILENSATGGVGYATGAGGAVTQITSRTTGVTLSKPTGAITLVSAAGSATPFSMTVTNTTVGPNDTVVVSQKSGTDVYSVTVSGIGTGGQFVMTITDLTGTTTEAPVFNFVILKGAVS